MAYLFLKSLINGIICYICGILRLSGVLAGNTHFYLCRHLTFSDALPIQFWLASQETFNEKTPSGVFRKCFCQPWECSDEIKVQFIATAGKEYWLAISDSDGNALGGVEFSEVADGVYSASIIPETYDACDTEIQLQVFDTTGESEILSNASFTTQLSPWVDESTPDAWSWRIGDKAEAAFVGPDELSPNLSQSIGDKPAGWYKIEYHVDNNDVNPSTFYVDVYNDGVLVQSVIEQSQPAATATSRTFVGIVYIESVFDKLKVRAIYDGFGSTFYLLDISLKRATYIAKSDCLNIKTTQDETVLITYSDNKSYASLQYSAISPDPEFYIRIPATFFHERFPEESEVIELSNSRSIQLNGQVKAQRQLEIGHMPYYMHRKMKLILKHQFVTIDEQDWVQSEPYELTDSSRRFPMRRANVWLDEKDYIIRNVL